MSFESRVPLMTELGFRLEAIPQLQAYVDLLWKSNADLNLISRKMTMEELIDNHIVDCLLALPHFPKGIKKCADFGSGGGMPAVIYAIQFPEMSYSLFEKSPKKREFLESCKKIAPNLDIQAEIPPSFSGYDLVTARAFKPVDVILDMSRNYYKEGGKYFLLKARAEKIEEELRDARKSFKDLKVEIVPLKSPVLDVERNIVLI